MLINRKIRVMAIVTEEFKKKLAIEIEEGLQQLDAEINFLEHRTKKTLTELTLKASPQIQAVREQLDWEKKKREDAKLSLQEQMKKLASLENEARVIQGELEGPVEIKVGDRWDELFNNEIVLKDGVIVEIR